MEAQEEAPSDAGRPGETYISSIPHLGHVICWAASFPWSSFQARGREAPNPKQGSPRGLAGKEDSTLIQSHLPPQWGLLARNAWEPCPLSSSQWAVEPPTGERGWGRDNSPAAKRQWHLGGFKSRGGSRRPLLGL